MRIKKISSIALFSLSLFLLFSTTVKSDEWEENKYYNEGAIVYFKNTRYTATEPGIGLPPNIYTKEWKKSDTLIHNVYFKPWEARIYYDEIDTLVTHNGKVWKNQSSTQGEEPGDVGNTVWTSVSLDFINTPKFMFDKQYKPGNVVKFNNILWESSSYQKNSTPGESTEWIQVGFTSYNGATDDIDKSTSSSNSTWQPDKSYPSPAIVVSHQGLLWRNSAPVFSSEEPGAAGVDVWDIVGIEREHNLETWNPDTLYSRNQAVIKNLHIWISRRESKGEEPGRSNIWIQAAPLESSIRQWKTDDFYHKGTTILFEGQRWVSMTANTNIQPNTAEALDTWALLNNRKLSNIFYTRDWNSNHSYPNIGTIVEYLDKHWVNIRPVYSEQDKPTSSDAWELIDTQTALGSSAAIKSVIIQNNDQWDVNTTYQQVGTTVQYNGLYYSNIASVLGGPPPPLNTQSWTPLSESLNRSTVNVDEQSWNINTIYPNANTQVKHQGKDWYNRYWTQGDEPNTDQVWQPITIIDGDDWNPYTVYDYMSRGEEQRFYIVTHNGKTWKNQWWTLGDEPGTNSVWQLQQAHQEGSSWDEQTVYSQRGMIVTHAGRRWFNYYYSQGTEPGTHEVWQPEEIMDGADWNRFFIYDYASRNESQRYYIVKYNGELWINRWWTLGQEPGSNDVWELHSN